MSKYDPLWARIRGSGEGEVLLSFAQIHDVLGFDIDHSFLNAKSELLPLGYRVQHISLKDRTVRFARIGPTG